MPDLSQEQAEPVPESERSRHRRKKKRHQSKLVRKIIIGSLFVLACMAALAIWHFLVQEPAPRASNAAPPAATRIKA